MDKAPRGVARRPERARCSGFLGKAKPATATQSALTIPLRAILQRAAGDVPTPAVRPSGRHRRDGERDRGED
jgi:hypothetical protein